MAEEYLLQGELNPQNLERLFELLQSRNLMGTLFVSDELTEKIIYFSMGGVRLIVVGEARTERVEDLLVRLDYITSAILKENQVHQEQHEVTTGKKIRIGDLLVERGVLSREKLQEVYTIRLQKELEDLFTWQGATYKFQEGSPSDQFYDAKYDSIGISFNLDQFVQSMKEKHQKFAQITQIIDSDRLVFEHSSKSISSASMEMNLPEKSVSAEEMEIYLLVDGQKSLKDMAMLVPHLDNKKIYELTFSLLRKRFIRKVSRDTQKTLEKQGLQKEIMSLEEAASKAVDQMKLKAKLARLYEEAGQADKAAEQYSQAGDLMAKKNAEQAFRHYEKALALNPQNLPLHKKLYDGYLQSNRMADAVNKGKEYAKILLGFGMVNRAREFFSNLVKLAPNDVEVRRDYAENLLVLHQEAEAVKQLKEVALREEKRGNHAGLVQTLEKIQKVDADDRAVRKKLYAIRGKKLQALLTIQPWTVIKMVIFVVLAFASMGTYYEYSARARFQKDGNQVRRLLRKGTFDKAQQILDRLKVDYSMSSIIGQVDQLEKEVRDAQGNIRKNRELKTVQRAVQQEMAGHLREAGQIYERLFLTAKNSEVRAIAQRGQTRLKSLNQRSQAIYGELRRLNFKGTDQEVQRAFVLAKELHSKFSDSVYNDTLRIPLRIYTLPKGADILVNGKYVENSPWTGKFSLSQKGQVIKVVKGGFEGVTLSLDQLKKNIFHLKLRPLHRKISLGSTIFKGVVAPGKRWIFARGEGLYFISLYRFKPIFKPLFPFENSSFPPIFEGEDFWISGRKKLTKIRMDSSGPVIGETQSLPISGARPLFSLGRNKLLLVKDSNLIAWDTTTKGAIARTVLDGPPLGQPAKHRGWIYIATSQKLYRLALQKRFFTVEILYTSPSPLFTSSPFPVNSRIYNRTNRGLSALFLSTSGESTFRMYSLSGRVDSIVHLKENKMVVVTSDEIACFEITKRKSEKLWSYPLPTPPSAPAVAVGEKVYLPCANGEVLAFWLREEMATTKIRGSLQWIFSTPSKVPTPVLVRGRKIYILSSGGVVYEVEK